MSNYNPLIYIPIPCPNCKGVGEINLQGKFNHECKKCMGTGLDLQAIKGAFVHTYEEMKNLLDAFDSYMGQGERSRNTDEAIIEFLKSQ